MKQNNLMKRRKIVIMAVSIFFAALFLFGALAILAAEKGSSEEDVVVFVDPGVEINMSFSNVLCCSMLISMKRMIATFMMVGCLSAYAQPMNVLVFSRTTGFRHDSIPAAITCLKTMAEKNNWRITSTENPAVFSDGELAKYDVSVWLMTTGDVLDAKEQDAFARFIRSGKGFVGIHSATITENDWPWFVGLAGAKFIGHPPCQKGRLIVEGRDHRSIPATMPKEWTREDEWYSFDRNPREKARVLISIDESSYDVDDNQWFPGIKQRMGDHPLVWCQEYDGGRAFQTALGHTAESYADPIFIAHLEGAIRWAAAEANQEMVR